MTSGVFNGLPQEVSTYLLSFLKDKELIPLSEVNSVWYETVVDIIQRRAPLKMGITSLVKQLDAETNKSQIDRLQGLVNDILEPRNLLNVKGALNLGTIYVAGILKELDSLPHSKESLDPMAVNLWKLSRIELNKDLVDITPDIGEKKRLVIQNFIDLSLLGYKKDGLYYLNSVLKKHPGLFADRIEMILASNEALETAGSIPKTEAIVENFADLFQHGFHDEAFLCLDRFMANNEVYLHRADVIFSSLRYLYTQSGKVNFELLKHVDYFPFQDTTRIISECRSYAAVATKLKKDNFSKRCTLLAEIFEISKALWDCKMVMYMISPERRVLLQKKCSEQAAAIRKIEQQAKQFGMDTMVTGLWGTVGQIALEEAPPPPKTTCILS